MLKFSGARRVMEFVFVIIVLQFEAESEAVYAAPSPNDGEVRRSSS